MHVKCYVPWQLPRKCLNREIKIHITVNLNHWFTFSGHFPGNCLRYLELLEPYISVSKMQRTLPGRPLPYAANLICMDSRPSKQSSLFFCSSTIRWWEMMRRKKGKPFLTKSHHFGEICCEREMGQSLKFNFGAILSISHQTIPSKWLI